MPFTLIFGDGLREEQQWQSRCGRRLTDQEGSRLHHTLAGRVLWWSRALAGLTVVLLVGTAILNYLTVVLVQQRIVGGPFLCHNTLGDCRTDRG
jgi:hypothetical protein